MTAPPDRGRLAKLALVAGGILFGILAGEIFFRLVPFERVKYEARYGHFSGNVVSRFLEYDRRLTFRNRRGAAFPDSGVAINTLGLRGGEVEPRKKAGVRRVLCLGDSCTFGARHPYPEILQSILDHRAPGRFEVLNGGVIGYTSLHGLEWFESELSGLEPDVVTIYFGWNDLWREKDSAVGEWFKSRIDGEPPPRARSYFLEAVMRASVFVRNAFGRTALQIPPERYRSVLERFASLGKERGFLPVFLTAPSGLENDHTPKWLVDQGFVARGDSAPALRRRYNEIVAEVAEHESLPLVDLAADFERGGGRKLFDDPEMDPIHPSAAGYQRIAAALADKIMQVTSTEKPTQASASR